MQIVELEMVPLSLRPVLQRLYDMKTTQSALREGVLFSTKRNNNYYDTGTGKVIVLDDDNLKTKMSITIFITHRYSSLRLADFILVLKDGELVESGSHQELQKAGKYYSELIKAQIEPIDHLAQFDET